MVGSGFVEGLSVDPSSVDLNTVGSLVSIGGLLPSFVQWFTGEYRAWRGKKREKATDTIAYYIEWLHRQRHKELLVKLKASQEAHEGLERLIRLLAAKSEKQQQAILAYLMQRDSASREQWDRIESKLDRAICLFHKPGNLDKDDRTFEREYLGHVKQQFQRLQVLGVSEMRQIRQELSVAYVSLDLKSPAKPASTKTDAEEEEESEATESCPAEEVLRDHPLLTIRGPAGSGKTTLLRWLALQCASTNENEERNPWRYGMPFYIPLRRLEESNQGRPRLERFVSYTIDPEVWSKQPPEGWIARVLEQGRALILIDGIDELPPDTRPKFWAWLEKFVQHQSGNRVYVTSRPFPEPEDESLGPLWNPPPEFAAAELDEMNDHDVKVFISKWHDAVILQQGNDEERLNLQRARERLPERLLEPRNKAVRELCRTPLLCALVCALYWREEGYLPASRIDLYDTCCTMLMELRDVKKELPPIEGPLGVLTLRDKEMILRRLALKMMRNETRTGPRQQIEIDRNQAVSWVRLFIPSCGSDEARKCTPGELVNYLIERSGLLREPAKGRIDFPHRTFQEYLAACAAGEENEAGDLAARAGDDQWQETILLAAGTKTGGAPFGNALIEELLRRGVGQKKNRTLRHACFALAVGCLETGGPNIKTDLRERVLSYIKEITPPQDFELARILAGAGEIVLPFLEYRMVKSRDVDTVAACARTISLIGSQQAIRMIESNAGYARDTRVTVVAELLKCPNIDLSRIPAVWRNLERANGLSRSLHPHVDTILHGIPKNTTRIALPSCAELRELSLPLLQNLWSLDLRGCGRLAQLSLPNLPNLRELDLRGCGGLAQLSLSNLRNLQELDLRGCAGLAQLSLSNLPNLQELDLRGCRGLARLSLPRLPNLRSLNLSGCEGLTQLSLPDLLNLWLLDLSECESLTQLSLPDLPNLRSLSLWMCGGMTQLSLPELPSLESLDLGGREGPTQLSLPKLPSLESLNLDGWEDLTQLSLPDMPNLQSLDLGGCEALTQLSLPDLPNLESLDLSGCRNLTQLSFADITSLKILNLTGCAGLKGHVPQLSGVQLKWSESEY